MGNHGAIGTGPASAQVAAMQGLVLAVVDAVEGDDLDAAIAAAHGLVVFLEGLAGGSADEPTEPGNDNGTMAGLTSVSPVCSFLELKRCA